MFAPPILSCFLIAWFSSVEKFQVSFGDNKFLVLSMFLFVIEGMGDSSTMFRAFLNKDILKKYYGRIVILPLIILALTFISPQFMVFLFILELFWDIWHSALQNWGVSRIYEAKSGNNGYRYRSLDRWLNLFIYIGPMLVFMTLSPQFYSKENFLKDTSFYWLNSLVSWLHTQQEYISYLVVLGGLFVLSIYLRKLLYDMKNGYKFPTLKFIFLLSWLILSVYANSLGGIYGAFIAVNVAHSIQTLGIAWWSENKNVARRYRLNLKKTIILFFSLIILMGAYEYYASFAETYLEQSNGKDISSWFNGPLGIIVRIRLVTNLLHYWADSFIWSIRKKELDL